MTLQTNEKMNPANTLPVGTIQNAERLSMTIFFALAIHAIIILGISFDLELLKNPADLITMEITLVHNKNEQAPEQADYLAQANQIGGGNIEDKVRPSSPFSNPIPSPEQGFAPHSRDEITPPNIEKQTPRQELLTTRQSKTKVQSEKQQNVVPIETRKITAAQLFERSREIAQISAEIDRLKQTYQQNPEHTYINSANAKQHRFASYLDAWRAKVERIGNVNYPSAAIHKHISGDLLMDVAINPDGSLHSVRIIRSSGYAVLDNAARRIVRLAAPYPPLPAEILRDTKVLHIPRVWRFKNNNRFGMSTR
ncbi:energy transducer TonB [Beggiatoa alba]|nr:energy transducer TonB [Beggiatoa alba]